MKNEKQLQAAIVMEFSQMYPEKDGQLFSVRNTTFSVRDGQTQKAMGMKKGVSDLIYFEGNMTAIEVKSPGSKHNKEHCFQQSVWGETIERCGGEYFVVTSVSGFMSIIKGKTLDEDVLTLEDFKEKIEKSGSEVHF